MRAYTQIWTGPTAVDHWATRFEAAGYHIECRGTEHVYLWLDCHPEWGIIPALDTLEQALGVSYPHILPATVLRKV